MKNIFKNWFTSTREVTPTAVGDIFYEATRPRKVANKLCKKCCIVKASEEFHKNKAIKDGLQDHCKKCRSLRKHGATSKLKKRTKKQPGFMKSITLNRSTSHLRIVDVPTGLKVAFYELAKQKKMSTKRLGHQMIRDFLVLNNMEPNNQEKK